MDRTSTSLVYRILSPDTLSRDSNSVYVMQSDASSTNDLTKDLHTSPSLDNPDNSLWFELRSTILGRCDQLHLQIIVIWVPRESKQFADYLSHLSTYLHRSSVYRTLTAESTSQRLEATIAMKSNSQYIIRVDKQYIQHTNTMFNAYPPSYDSQAIFLSHFEDTQ